MLTFAEIEPIIGQLPAQARNSGAWWGATAKGRFNYAHASAWHRAGSVADPPDFAAETVTFRRIVP